MTPRHPTRPRAGTLTRASDGTQVPLRFEQMPEHPRDFRALDATTGQPVVFHRGDQVVIDVIGPGQRVLIADCVTKRPE